MTTRRAFLTSALSLPALAIAPVPTFAATPEFFKTDGFAAGGYDVISYFREEKAVRGEDQFTLKWKGAMWRFASADNMAMFESDAWTYAPQYGGYCAFAMAKGAIARSVPEAWTVHDGKLFLNQSKIVRALWKRDIPGFVQAANRVWPDILTQ